jgi:hypothetical protein
MNLLDKFRKAVPPFLGFLAGVVVALLLAHVRLAPVMPDLSLPQGLKAKVGKVLTIKATGHAKKVGWIQGKGPAEADFIVHSPKECHFVASVPGVYSVVAFADVSGALISAETVVQVEGVVPPPPPIPPVPPVPPGPSGQKLFVSVFLDETTKTPAQGKLLDSASLRNALKAAGHDLRVFDPSSPTAQKFSKFTAPVGFPCVVLQLKEGSDKGKVLKAVPLPKTEEDFLGNLK